MPKVLLPQQIKLTCPDCKGRFIVYSQDIRNKAEICCPWCGESFDVYDGVDTDLKRRIYQAVRDEIEQRVYEQTKMNELGYFEDWGNLPTGR